MPEPIYVLVNFVSIFLEALTLGMCLRAILGWFVEDDSGKLMHFLYVLTEPVILPTRKLFEKMNWFQGIPIDMAYMFAYIEIMILDTLVTVLAA